MFTSEGRVYVEEEDQCDTCEYGTSKNELCPLIEALSHGLVCLETDLLVKNCGFFKVRERRLKVVED